MAPGDLFVLHTDGLDVLHEKGLFEALCAQEVGNLAQLLVDAALAAGTQDNVTVVAVVRR